MRIFFWVLAIWILTNVLFVIFMTPGIRRRTDIRTGRNADLPDEHDPTFGQILPAVAMSAYFMLVPIIAKAVAALRPHKNYHRDED